MRPAKAKVRLLSGDMEWLFTLGAAGLEISTLKLPPTQSKDPQGRVADRLFLLEEGTQHLERRFQAFLTVRAQDPDDLQETLRSWLQAGLESLATAASDEVPWEG
jgi:hypothetical protein